MGRNTVKSWFTDYELSDYLTDEEIAVITAQGTWDKDKLADAIIDHYYMYEIGYETPALFAHQAKVFMRELMEEKAPLLYSAAIQYDPLVNLDVTETYAETNSNNSTSSSTSNSTNSGLTVNSDTPQGQISKAAILNGTYASSTGANESTNAVTDSTTAGGTGAQNYTKTTRGNSGVSATSQKMIQQYRENIIMIRRDIIKDVGSLFMTLY